MKKFRFNLIRKSISIFLTGFLLIQPAFSFASIIVLPPTNDDYDNWEWDYDSGDDSDPSSEGL